MHVQLPPRPLPPSLGDWYHVKAVGWPVRRRVNPTVVRTLCQGYGHLARVVLWLECMGYRCKVSRLRTHTRVI